MLLPTNCSAVSHVVATDNCSVPSGLIPWGASAHDIELALYKIPLITLVSVKFSQPGNKACAAPSAVNVITIEFLQQFGALPPLVPWLDPVMTAGGGAIFVGAEEGQQQQQYISTFSGSAVV